MGHLEPHEFEQAFPFYLQLDEKQQICAMGRSLEKACPALMIGQIFTEQFKLIRPHDGAQLVDLAVNSVQILLESRGSEKARLRGAVLPRGDGFLLLLSVVLNSMDDMKSLGLTMFDFACHDASGDMLLIHQTNMMSLSDANRLAARLKAKSLQLDTMMLLSADGMAYFGSTGTLDYANPSLDQLLGFERLGMLGMARDAFEEWFYSACCEVCATPLFERLLRSHQALRFTLLTPQSRVLELHARQAGEGGIVLYVRDISNEAELDRMKTEFLTMAAHELRTPLASIRGFSELLMAREMPQQMQRDMFTTINRQSVHMAKLIDELLSISRLDATNQDALTLIAQPIRGLIDTAIESSFAGHPDFQVDVIEQGYVPQVLVDRHTMLKLLSNLFGNAIKFSPQQKLVCVRISPAESNSGEGVEIVLSDSGIGMDSEQQAHAFERFYRADTSGHLPGAGLGLAMARDIVKLHDGLITLSSRPGVGTCVKIWLPAAPSAAVPLASMSAAIFK